MPKSEQSFGRLSARERAVVGSPGDYDWDKSVKLPARAVPDAAQFSLRVERELYLGLQELARREDATFSDVVRHALRSFVRSGGVTGLSNVVVTFGNTPLLLQVQGQRAEVPTNRRIVRPDEKIPNLPGIEPPITTATG